MITVSNLGMQFGGQWLFQHVDLQFLPGNCYGIIGANGAGKSTFLRLLYGELESTTGHISIPEELRVSVLKQNQNAYDEYTVMDTVIMGNQHLYDVMKEPLVFFFSLLTEFAANKPSAPNNLIAVLLTE